MISGISNLDNFPYWLHWVEQCSSTNTWAMDCAAQLQHGDVVFTRGQTAGRGQHGRTWYAPAGVLTASFVLDRLPISQLPGLSLAAGLAVIYAVEDLLPSCLGTLRLKWPNDVLIEQRKLAGILCETTSSQLSTSTRVIVGVGLNRCADFGDEKAVANAVSLHQVSSVVPDELPLLERLRHYLIQVADILTRTSEDSGLAALLPELGRRDALLDRSITIDLAGKTVSGQAAGIDACGRLQLRLPDSRVCTFTSGRVVWS